MFYEIVAGTFNEIGRRYVQGKLPTDAFEVNCLQVSSVPADNYYTKLMLSVHRFSICRSSVRHFSERSWTVVAFLDIHTWTNTHTHTHTHTHHTHTHARTDAHTHTHTHARTHAHTQSRTEKPTTTNTETF